MRQAYGKLGVMLTLDSMFQARPHFIVERSVVQGDGSSYTMYLSFPGEWSEDEANAMRFPQRVLAESHARRFKGTVRERAS